MSPEAAMGLPTTGETGVFRIQGEDILDPNTNILRAYSNFRSRLQTGKPLTGQDFLQLRNDAYSLRTTDDGSDLVTLPGGFRNSNTATFDAEIPPYVQERLRHYGIEYRINNGRTTIAYGESSRGPPLDRLASEVNEMIRLGHPPERIAALVVQDLLIIHPFRGGNGRTARVAGQAIYQQLTGRNIVFPDDFHKEMEKTLDQLTESILPPPPHKTNNLSDLSAQAYANNRSLPALADPASVHGAGRNDVPFVGQVRLGNQNISYRDFPLEVRRNNNDLFFGAPGGSTIEDAEKAALTLMRNGRGTQQKPEIFDLQRYTEATTETMLRSGPPGHFSASEQFHTARGFALPSGRADNNFGVVAIIDPRGADVMNLHRVSYPPNGRLPRQVGQAEVVFWRRMNPDRIQAVAIVDRQRRVVRIIHNPEYLPRAPVTIAPTQPTRAAESP